MRTLAFALLAACAAGLAGCDAPERPTRTRLKIGDPAPELSAVTWLTGGGFDGFKPGTVYVLEFWATWCPPCLDAMPELAAVQRKYAADNVVVVPVTNADAQQSELDIEKYVRRHGPEYALVFARCADRATQRAYVGASGLQGIPQSFVVDRDGKIAFIGRPEELDAVLAKVVGK